MFTNYGKGFRHPDGSVETGTPDPMPPPAADWPPGLTEQLRLAAKTHGWSPDEAREFRRWAMRSPQGIADARLFLEAPPD